MGGQTSKLQEELDQTKKQLADVQAQASSREAELRDRVLAYEVSLRRQDVALANAARECSSQLETKEQLVQKANKQREITEELRRSDALLVKRVTSALLRREANALAPALSPDGLIGGSMAAELTVAADSGLRLRQALQQSAAQLEAANSRVHELQLKLRDDARRELCDSLWLPKHFDLSIALRSAPLMVLGGLRLPRAQQAGLPASGLSGGLGVLRTFQMPALSQAGLVAIAGSMLWDARERELAALKLAACVQPSPTQQLCVSFDQTGSFSLGAKASVNALSVRVSGSVDANRRRAAGATVEVAYDLD